MLLLPWPGFLLKRAKCKKEPFSALMLDKTHDEGNALAHGECTFQANLQTPTIGINISTDLALALVPLESSVSDVVSSYFGSASF